MEADQYKISTLKLRDEKNVKDKKDAKDKTQNDLIHL